jgi:hypothetical protein
MLPVPLLNTAVSMVELPAVIDDDVAEKLVIDGAGVVGGAIIGYLLE